MDIGAKLKAWGVENTQLAFALLRTLKPNVSVGNVGVITRFTDVQEALSRPDIFGVTYAEKMAAITDGSNFFLGMNPSAHYTRDVSIMRLLFRGRDVSDRIAPLIAQISAQLLEDSRGEVDVIQHLMRKVPARLTAQYIGVDNVEEEALIDWNTLMFRYLFYPNNPPELKARALASAALFRREVERCIAGRKASPTQADDILNRALALQRSGTEGISDRQLRDNLIGIIIGLIPTTAACSALVIDYLLDHPHQLRDAQEAARNNDDERLRKYTLEALRFNSFGAGVFRILLEDYTLARGTLRAKCYKQGTTVLVATQSAMHDSRQLTHPQRFSLTRPDYHYMHFGYGMHRCFGYHINMVQIPQIIKVLLRKRNLKRAEGTAGRTLYEGPFPRHLYLTFDH
ncbi:MAG: cytochrome P450 [Pseudomonadales bacterium]